MYSVLSELILRRLAIVALVTLVGMLCIKKSLEIGFIGTLSLGKEIRC